MKYIIEHPSAYIAKEFSDSIRNAALEAEQRKELQNDQLKIIYDQRWFKMLVPQKYGGMGLTVPEVLKIEEGTSYADGSTGWVVTLCSGAAWFAGFIQPSVLDEVFRNEKACFAGSGGATGIANFTADGYEINGFWKYASGSLHATVFTANCVVQKDGHPQYDADGSLLIRAFLLYKDEVILHRQWNSMGMIATASHSFEMKGVKVPANRCFTIDAKFAILKDPVYEYPFLQLAETTLTVNLSGMAVRFLDLCAPLFSERMRRRNISKSPDLYQKLAAANSEMNSYRFAFYTAVEESWQICERGQGFPQVVLEDVSKSSYALAHRSRQLVDDLYQYCGLIAADTHQEINRVWRNIHTASQHALFTSG